MKYLYCLILLLCFVYPSSAQIKWDLNRPLTWDDFTEKVDTSVRYPHFSANTSTVTKYWTTNLRYNPETQQYTIDFTVECVFLKATSWYLRQKQSPELLKHEQTHFDIAELFTRKLLTQFRSTVFTSNYKNEIKAIYDANWKEKYEMQVKYDNETNHCAIKEKQQEWEQAVQAELRKTMAQQLDNMRRLKQK